MEIDQDYYLEDSEKIAANYRMYDLPNQPNISQEEFKKRWEQINDQCLILQELAAQKANLKKACNALFETTEDQLKNAKQLFFIDPQVFAEVICTRFNELPSDIQVKLAQFLLDNSTELLLSLVQHIKNLTGPNREKITLMILSIGSQTIPDIVANIKHFPSAERFDFFNFLLKSSPSTAIELARFLYLIEENLRFLMAKLLVDTSLESAKVVANEIKFLEPKDRLPMIYFLLDRSPEISAPVIARNLIHVSEDARVGLAHTLLKLNPREVTLALAYQIDTFPENNQEEMIYLLLNNSTKQSFKILASNTFWYPLQVTRKIIPILLEFSNQDTSPELVHCINYLPEEMQVTIARLALEKDPIRSSEIILNKIHDLSESNKLQIANLLLTLTPQLSGSSLMLKIEHFSDNLKDKISRMALELAPNETTPTLISEIRYLPEETQSWIIKQLLELDPEKYISSLALFLPYFSPSVRAEYEATTEKKAKKIERDRIYESERRNQLLYKDHPKAEKFFRQEFYKTGTTSILLGQSLINKAILRIIPYDAFLSWIRAYQASETWKMHGFNYVPIEPIMKAYSAKNKEMVRVYSGVLGISLQQYIRMTSQKRYHELVNQKAKKIEEVLKILGIDHRHPHNGNFCILHERTSAGEIDWDKPPRVYCIDFDAATTKDSL